MSATVAPCRECHGKFGIGPVCGVCECLLRLRLFVASGRCPNSIGPFVSEKVREAHRLVLEEAERWWASQPVTAPLNLTSKAGPPSAPPLASGGGVVEPAETPRKREATAEVEKEEKTRKASHPPGEEVHSPHRHRRHHRKSRSRHTGKKEKSRSRHTGKKEKRKSRSKSPVRPVEVVKEEKESPRSKKSKVESEPSELVSSFEEVEEEPARPSSHRRAPSPVHREPAERRRKEPRSPSRSPPPRRRWEGPIPAYHHRGGSAAGGGRKKKAKKNKGIIKRENHKRWLRDFGRYRR